MGSKRRLSLVGFVVADMRKEYRVHGNEQQNTAWTCGEFLTVKMGGLRRLATFAKVDFRFSLPSAPLCGIFESELNDNFKANFWSQFPGLVWSNANAGDSVRIRAALLKPKFHVLLAIAVEFGCGRLIEEWSILQADPLTDTSGAAPSVNRILKNILRGYQQACS
jgi:hypothetical protein